MRPYRVSAAHYLLLEKIGGLAPSRSEYNVPSQHESHFLTPLPFRLSGFRFHVSQAASFNLQRPDRIFFLQGIHRRAVNRGQ